MKKVLQLALCCLLVNCIVLTVYGQPANDNCAAAIDISSIFDGAPGTMSLGPFTNVGATVEATDPEPGCWGEPSFGGTILNQTVWFTFTLAAAGDYFIEIPSCGAGFTDEDTQFALYEGGCGALTAVNLHPTPGCVEEACNEDGPNATDTTYPAGATWSLPAGTYFMLVDGFDCSNPTDCGGSISEGEFCIEVTEETAELCFVGDITDLGDQSACPNGFLSLVTDGCENLDQPCSGGTYVYYWGIAQDLDNSNDFSDGDNVLGIFFGSDEGPYNATNTLIDWGIGDLDPGEYIIYGLLACTDADGNTIDADGDGTIDEACSTPTETPLTIQGASDNCAPGNDDCANASSLNSLIPDGGVVGYYYNNNATANPSDPLPGCFPDNSIDNSVWFTITIDPGEEGFYFIEASSACAGTPPPNPLPFDDTQLAIFTDCNGTPYNDISNDCTSEDDSCNEDGPNQDLDNELYPAGLTIELIAGTYYIMVDGFLAEAGEFCMEITPATPTCIAGDIDPNLVGLPNTQEVCFDDILILSTDGCEDLSIDCPGGTYAYEWGIAEDLDASGSFSAGDNVLGIFNSTLGPSSTTLTVEELGLDFITSPGLYIIYGGAICRDADGNALDFCFTSADIPINLSAGGEACPPLCAAGDIDPTLDNPQIVCPNGTLNLGTDGTEDLTIECASDDGSGYQYGWIVAADTDGDNVIDAFVTPTFTFTDDNGNPTPNVTVTAGNIMIDSDDVFGNGVDAPLPAGTYEICGIAGCYNSDNTAVLSCRTPNCFQVILRDPLDPVCSNDECDNAFDISGAFPAGDLLGYYDNLTATANPSDPLPACFPDNVIDNSVWFTFTINPGEEGFYFIEASSACGGNPPTNPLPFDDTQMALYTDCAGTQYNTCISGCNEDGPNQDLDNQLYPAALTIDLAAGTYYLMVDGYEGESGEFCIEVIPSGGPSCLAGNIDPALVGLANTQEVCFDDVLILGTDGCEDLTIDCPGGTYAYEWGIAEDLDGSGTFTNGDNVLGIFNSDVGTSNTTLTVAELGLDFITSPGLYIVYGGAICRDADGNALASCFAETDIPVNLSVGGQACPPLCAAGDISTTLDQGSNCNIVALGVTGEDLAISCPSGSYCFLWRIAEDVDGDGTFNTGDIGIGTLIASSDPNTYNGTYDLSSLGLPDPDGFGLTEGTQYVIYGIAACSDQDCVPIDGDDDGFIDRSCSTPSDIFFTFTNTPSIAINSASGCDVSATVTGGLADYTWEILMGADSTSFDPAITGTSSDGAVAATLPDGTEYVLSVTDANGCVTLEAFTVDPACVNCSPNSGTVTGPAVTALCPTDGLTFGPASVTGQSDATAGTPDYAYIVTGPAPGYTIIEYSTDGGFTATGPGNYCVHGLAYDAAAAGDLNGFIGQPAANALGALTDAGVCYDLVDAPYCVSTCSPVTGAPNVTINCAADGLSGVLNIDLSALSGGCGGQFSIVAGDTGGSTVTTTNYEYNWSLTLSDGNCTYDFAATTPLVCTPPCPTVVAGTEIAGSGSACSTDAATADLTALNAGVTIDDPGQQSTGISWYTDIAYTSPVANPAAAPFPAATGCNVASVTYYAALGCASGTNVAAGQATYIAYPDITGMTTVSPDGCIVSITQDCPGYEITWVDDLGGSSSGLDNSYTAAANTSGMVTFTISVAGAPEGCNSATFTELFDCEVPCGATVTTPAAINETSCSVADATVDLTAIAIAIDDPDGQITATTWYEDNAYTTPVGDAAAAALPTADGCDPVSTTYYAAATCDVNGTISTLPAGQATYTAYPAVTGTATTSMDGCMASATIIGNCLYDITWDDGLGGTGNGATYDADDNTSGTVTFTITVDGAPDGCNSTTAATAFNCVVGCSANVTTAADVNETSCSVENATVNLTSISISIDDPAGQVTGPTWYEDDAYTTPVEDATAAALPTATGCDAATVTYYAAATCDVNGTISTLPAGQATYTAYPAVTGTPTDGGCIASISQDCPTYVITWDDGLGGTGTGTTYTAAEGTDGTVTFSISSDGAPEGCNSASFTAAFACEPGACTFSVTTPASGGDASCSADGATVDLTAFNGDIVIDDPDGNNPSIAWYEDAALTTAVADAAAAALPTASGCDAATVTYYAAAGCSIDGSNVSAGSVTYTVYPELTGSANDDGDACTASVTDDCGNTITWDDGNGNAGDGATYTAEAGTSGTVTFTISSADGTCPSIEVTDDYDCRECLSVSGDDAIDACSGDVITLTATISGDPSTGEITGWEDDEGNNLGTDASVDVSEAATGCSELTKTYQYTVTCSADGVSTTQTVTVTFYPDPEATTFIEVDETGCLASAINNCPGFDVSPRNLEADGFGESDAVFTVTNENAPAELACAEVSVVGAFNCKGCPTITEISAASDACSGDEVSLSATVEDLSETLASVVWTNAAGDTLSTEAMATVSDSTACNTITRTYTFTATCSIDTDPITGTVDVTYYAAPTASITSSIDGCTLTASTDCENFTIEGEASVSTETVGSTDEVSFTVTNAGAPEACASATITGNFNCIETSCITQLDGVSAAASAVCSGGSVELSATVTDESGIAYTVEWFNAADDSSVGTGESISVDLSASGCSVETASFYASLTSEDPNCAGITQTSAPVSVDILPALTLSASGDCENGYVFASDPACDLGTYAVTAEPASTDAGLLDAGSVSVTLSYADFACEATTSDFEYDCTPKDCGVSVDGASAACSGDEVSLTATPEGAVASITWTDAATNEELGTGETLSVSAAPAGCSAETVTVVATAACEDGSEVTASYSVTFYPAPTGSATASDDGCSVTATADCPDFAVDGEDTFTAEAGTSGTANFTIVNAAAVAMGLDCGSADVSADYDCAAPAGCPTVSVGAGGEACSGGSVELTATVDDPDGTLDRVEWSLNGSAVGDGNSFTASAETNGCETMVQTYTFTAYCTDGNTSSGEATATFYPAPSGSASVDESGCVVTATADCGEVDGEASFIAGAGESGTATFTIINPDFDCGSIEVSADYDCPVIEECPGAISATGELTCNDDGTGTYTITITGGVPPFTVDGFEGIDARTFSTDVSGTGSISVTITDASGGFDTPCDAIDFSDNYECAVTECSAAIVAQGSTDCNVDGTGTYTLQVSGGTPPYTVSGTFEADGDGPFTFDISGAVEVNLTVDDSSDECEATSVSESVECAEQCVADINVTGSVSCADGTYTITVSGGDGNYTVDGWDDNGDGTYTQSVGEEGSVSAIVSDGSVCDDVSFNADYNCLENVPPVTPDEATTITTPAGGGETLNFNANDFASDPNGDDLTLTDASSDDAAVSFDANGGITVDIPEGFEGTITVTYTVSDGEFESSGSIIITVEPAMLTCADLPGIEIIVNTTTIDESNYRVYVYVTGGLPSSDGSQYNISASVEGTEIYSGSATTEEVVIFEASTPTGLTGFDLNVSADDDLGCTMSVSKTVVISLSSELISFTGEVLTVGNLVKWVTASETNTDFFTLHHSVDGINYTAINTQKAAGNSTSAIAYEFLDKSLTVGTNYYRLTQTDLDGTANNLGDITLTRGESNFGFIDVVPVPAHTSITVAFNADINTMVTANIYDVTGKLVESRRVAAGENTFNVNVSNYTAGVYFIAINNGQAVATSRFVVKH